MKEMNKEVMERKLMALERELRECRNELCSRCGAYKEAYLGACDHCRYRFGGEWEKARA